MSDLPTRKAKVADERGGAALAAGAACDHCGDALAGLKVVERTLGGARARYCCLGCAFIAEQLFRARARAGGAGAGAAEPGSEPAATASGVADTAAVAAAHAQVEVQGMVCSACALLVEDRLRRVPGVTAVQVEFGTRRAYVAFDPRACTVVALEAAVRRAGYRTRQTAEQRRRGERMALLGLLLAWFAMMQVMMLALPAYVAGPGELPADLEQLLRIAQLVLTVPVALLSARPLYRAALTQWRARAVGMDLPIVLGLSAAFAASAWATLRGDGAVYFDSITMFVALVLGSRWLQARALARAYEHIDAAQRGACLQAQRLPAWPGAQATETVAAERLRPGEFVLVPAGEAVPADGTVRHGRSAVSQAWLTGESTPIDKGVGAAVLAGSVNLEQPLVVEVVRAAEATSLAALRRLVDEAGRARPRIVESANRVAVGFLWAVLAITVLTVGGWLLVDPAQALPHAIAVLVATCPCALSLAAPVALSAAQSGLARRGVLTARVAALEQLAAVDVLACDKTGTLTTGEPSLHRLVLLRAQAPERVLAVAAALESLSAHPLARATVNAARRHALAPLAVHDGVVESSAGVVGLVEGQSWRIGRSDYALAPLPDAAAAAAEVRQRIAAEGLHAASVAVLADAAGPVALLAFGETLRADAVGLVAAARDAGVEALLLSGDRREPVARIAGTLGIERWYAHQTPQSKRELILGLQADGRRVAMLGDGINDAPVLAQADVSFALASGSQLAQARADFIVLSPRLTDVGAALRLGRRAMAIVRQNLAWAFAYNVLIVPLAAFGYVSPAGAAVGMAASSLLVVANALRARGV